MRSNLVMLSSPSRKRNGTRSLSVSNKITELLISNVGENSGTGVCVADGKDQWSIALFAGVSH